MTTTTAHRSTHALATTYVMALTNVKNLTNAKKTNVTDTISAGKKTLVHQMNAAVPPTSARRTILVQQTSAMEVLA